MKKRAAPLTDRDWERVFALRCRSKRGEYVSDEDRALLVAAHAADPDRYAGLNDDIFRATAPFGARQIR